MFCGKYLKWVNVEQWIRDKSRKMSKGQIRRERREKEERRERGEKRERGKRKEKFEKLVRQGIK